MHSIDISHLPPGAYTAELHYDNQCMISKVIKQ
ncbi:T9SS type A sorting domain-containing protein [Polluticoccus soli]|nr:T9SS type A sorting domain-containing protein [Flavipsychrobacter sp. JY13-12]